MQYMHSAASQGFTLPESPFAHEKAMLGEGFLVRVSFRSRARRFAPIVGNKNHGKARCFPRLTDAQKDYIGSTGREIPRRALAIRFSISEETVGRLRKEFKQRHREGAKVA